MKGVLSLLVISFLFSTASTSLASSIFKCKAPNGGYTFSDRPCPPAADEVPVLTGKGTMSSSDGGYTTYRGRSAVDQLRAMEAIKQVGRPSRSAGPSRSSAPRQNQLSYDEQLQIRNNNVTRNGLIGSNKPHVDRKLRSLDRADEAIRGRAYVPDPEPIIIHNHYPESWHH